MVDFKSFFFNTGFEQYSYNVPWSVFFVFVFVFPMFIPLGLTELLGAVRL